MTPFRMRLFIVVFLSVAAAIAVNALYLQHAPRLAVAAVQEPPRLTNVERAAPTAALPRQDPIAADPAVTSAPAAPPAPVAPPQRPADAAPKVDAISKLAEVAPRAPLTAEKPVLRQTPPAPARLVKAIQRELLARGYADEPATGTLRTSTRAAILAYEFDEGMPLSGEPSEAILKSLIFGRVERKAAPGVPARFEERQALISEVQGMLAALGYQAGPADGRLDEKTRDAIRRFESDRHLEIEGRLTERVLLEMVIVAGRPINSAG